MRFKILFTIILISFLPLISPSQTFVIDEGFESYDSLTLPPGWTVWNAANFPIQPFSNWTVRDTGRILPGVQETRRSKAHSGLKAIGVSWYTGIDTNTNQYGISDAWLVTKRINVTNNQFIMIYYVAGGSVTLKDSLQIWVSTIDSLPQNFTHYIYTKVLGPGSWGTFEQEIVDLSSFNGQTIWIGFRYNMDVSVDGIFVHIDDVTVINPIGIQQISSNVPKTFTLKQNYPNPFNPVTYIEFDLPKPKFVNLIVYNSAGQEVKTLVNEDLKAGSYKVDFNASNLPSGVYYYRITAGDFVKTNKMILVK